MSEKIAIVIDSGLDVSDILLEGKGYDIFTLPLRIIIDGKEYTDRIDITGEQVYAALDVSKVSSSLPGGAEITSGLEDIKAKGYTHIIALSISSGLSGTYNILNHIASEMEGIKIHVIDTLNVSLGGGFAAIKAAEYVQQGLDYETIIKKIEGDLPRSKVYFTMETLEYLRRGGRIGLVAGSVANVLNIKPIMSVNEDGVYHTVAKVRGYRRSISMMIDIAAEYAKQAPSCRVVLLHPQSNLDLNALMDYIKEKMPHNREVVLAHISPSMGVHTGPEAMGIAVSLED